MLQGPANWAGAVDWVSEARYPAGFQWVPEELRERARDQLLPLIRADALITDPPYYDAIPYRDLSNVFYVWERELFKITFPDLFDEGLIRQDR